MNIKESRDIKLLAELNREIQDLHYKMYPDKYKPFKLENFIEFYKKLLKNDNISCFICFLKHDPIGSFLIEEKLHPEGPFSYEFKFIYIQQIFIKQEYRKQGFGKEIIDKIKSIAKERNIKFIHLDVKEKNDIARTFFRNSGFSAFSSTMELTVN